MLNLNLMFAHPSSTNEKGLSPLRETLRFLKLLCEGHNSEMQNYLRVQSFSKNSFDLINDVIQLLNSLFQTFLNLTKQV